VPELASGDEALQLPAVPGPAARGPGAERVRIEVGQDALGLWAWMIVDERGRLVASDDQYRVAALAMADATNHLEIHERSCRRKLEPA
jgi:hypothetical protein